MGLKGRETKMISNDTKSFIIKALVPGILIGLIAGLIILQAIR